MAYTEADRRYKRSPAGKAADARRWRRFTPEKREAIRQRQLAASRKWKADNPQKAKDYARWAKIKFAYGLTRLDWEALFATQGNVCGGCGKETSGSKRGWVTDHSHADGTVRGILCLQCNVVLGMVKDDADHLRSLARYLEERVRL